MRHAWMLAPAAALLMAAAGAPAGAQGTGRTETGLPHQKLAGPRFGVTTFGGDVARLRRMIGRQPVMMQFGWQFEDRIVSLESGHQAVVELVHLVGGLGQGEVNVTAALLLGLRSPSGLEIGMGPSVGYSHETESTTQSMVVAGGATLPLGEMYVPLNVAVALAEGGPRFSTLVGWIVG